MPLIDVGRFAPSPTGPLHMGSLVTALASYLDVKSLGGRWLVRMENLDPPREMRGAEKLLLKGLVAHGLEWDGEVVFQSKRKAIYDASLLACLKANKVFPCTCSRQDLVPYNGVYPGTCRHRKDKPKSDYAYRLRLDPPVPNEFVDSFQGLVRQDILASVGDYVLRRKDGLYAYQFAVVVDDALQNVTRVIRGVDLLESTLQQIYLQKTLGFASPVYGHVPVIINENGQKLSKRAYAAQVEDSKSERNLYHALILLQQEPPFELCAGSNAEIIAWAIENWRPERLQGQREIPASVVGA